MIKTVHLIFVLKNMYLGFSRLMENMLRAQMGYECKNWDWFFSSFVVHPVVELTPAKLSSHFFLQILKNKL